MTTSSAARSRPSSTTRPRGYDVTYREYNGGRNDPAWRNDLPRALEAMLGG
jgi:enterochelin esterase-like enzyme